MFPTPVAAPTLIPIRPPVAQNIAINTSYTMSTADVVVCTITPDLLSQSN